MEHDNTIELLKECSSGCKMAIDGIEQVMKYIKDDSLMKIIKEQQSIHQNIEAKTDKLLKNAGEEKKEPSAAVSAFSWITSGAKLMMDSSSHEIAKLMMDGCNMGIQSVCMYQNKYTEASSEAKEIAARIVDTEELMYKQLQKFL